MELADDKGTAVPVTILTGFLGAGKTTLLNRILNGDHGLKVAVLVNDFGAINIDSQLIVGVEDNAISLANGCVCCQIRDDLIETVEGLIERPEGIEYILLEASGVADPSGIAMTFVSAQFRDRIRLDSITCVVDAEQVFAHPEYPELAELKMRQIAFSDMVLLNKVDLAGHEQVKKVQAWIDDRINNIRVVQTNYCDAPYEILLAVGRFDPARLIIDGDGHPAGHENGRSYDDHRHDHGPGDHGDDFDAWSYETDRPMSMEAVRQMAKKLPGSVYRCKGVVYTAEAPDRRAVLQVVGRRADVSLYDEWGARQPRTQIVAIGAPGGIDAHELTERFDDCLIETIGQQL